MLTSSHTKSLFKRLLVVFGLIMIFASVIEQGADNYLYESSSSSQVSMMQLDKDNNRDVGDAVSVFTTPSSNLFQLSNLYYFYNSLYQEPTLLVHPRPPNT